MTIMIRVGRTIQLLPKPLNSMMTRPNAMQWFIHLLCKVTEPERPDLLCHSL